ncbi:MAG: hypothetical protein K2R98_19420 [Gemmataceae bacterium]|nr:hypothetical protein [Gemmataceae bacterium]
MPKRGRLSNDESNYIRINARKLTVDEIAANLDRTPLTVRDFIEKNVPPDTTGMTMPKAEAIKVTVRQELRHSMAWKSLNDEFTNEELEYFEERYVTMMSQFKEDVLPTEETQIFLLIKFEILMNRNLKERRRARDDIERLMRVQTTHLKQFQGKVENMDDAAKQFMLNVETQIISAKAAESTRTTEYVKLEEKHQALMKDLKGTRDQRISKATDAKVSFLGLIKNLQEHDIREAEGRQMELMRLATEKELRRLGQPHKYDDGNQDQPVLSAETVEMLDELE